MARVLQGTAVTTPTIRQSDPLADLNRLLSRLQQTVLRADADRERRLRTSEYERRKAETVSIASPPFFGTEKSTAVLLIPHCIIEHTICAIPTAKGRAGRIHE